MGYCRTGNGFAISSFNLHHGEEPPISGYKGSATIFFANCNLSCVFCQNYPISQLGHGNKSSVEKLTLIMLDLQAKGAHNINLVTPTHVIPWVIDAVLIAKEKGLKTPLVYNCGGYESIVTLKLLDGLIDIYMPDAKYSDNKSSLNYSKVKDYWAVNKTALKEMHRQVGDLKINEDGIATKGLLIRHLILPGGVAGSKEVLKFIVNELSPEVYVSLMAQYHPAHLSAEYPEVNRRITSQEYGSTLKYARRIGLKSGWTQELT